MVAVSNRDVSHLDSVSSLDGPGLEEQISHPEQPSGLELSAGGARMIYYWAVAHDRILMLDIYAKNEQEDLSAAELKQLRTLIEDYKT